jgi:hypothetical protein
MTLQSIKWKNGKLEILDQLLLPAQLKYIEVTGVNDGWSAIHKMQVSNIDTFIYFFFFFFIKIILSLCYKYIEFISLKINIYLFS